MNVCNHRITELSYDEYVFLNENFEFANSQEIKKGVSYIVTSKRKNIIKTIKKILEEELSTFERQIAIDYWGEKIPINEILKKYNISKSAFYRNIEHIKELITTYLKYVFYYEELSISLSAAELISYIRGEEVEI